MIARHETHMDKMDIWSKLSAPLPSGVISWRQDGKPVQRDGKFVARFVAYIDANTVRERLDSVVPGEWDLTLELLPTLSGQDENGEQTCSFKARLQILGVIREDVGTGRDYKSAATDAFKRAAVRFGIAHELYGFEQNWVQVDGDGRYAKPLDDPAAVYARRQARAEARERQRGEPVDDGSMDEVQVETTLAGPASGPLALDEPSCPKCGGRMWDNRLSKRNPKAPDYKCRNRSCDGVIWPAKPNQRASANATSGSAEPTLALASDVDTERSDGDHVPF
ncbi:MAG TPA: Rad52/Rad22 family DNA repair protein [Gemmatimonadaceae bacterium]|nr:Rad52/Rad22 family DNA repair protein [Gemmatimonadaceae bacterium]